MKHSKKIRNDIATIIELKKKYSRLSKNNLKDMAIKQANFLYNNYFNIFNKIFNEVIDLNMFHKFLVILEGIENGVYDQHEASSKVGAILKEIYLDSAIREADRKKHGKKNKIKERKGKKISWDEFKKMNN